MVGELVRRPLPSGERRRVAVCTGTSVAPCALPTHLRTPQTPGCFQSLPLRRSLAKREREGPDDCNFARGRESSWPPTSRNAEESGKGEGESFKFNAVRFISGCGLLGGRNDLIRACARRQAAPPSRGNSISLRR